MLRRLSIQNLILVQQCEVPFHPGFNVITGETGSGKSVLLTAISLLLGERADPDLVRHGEERAIIEGDFDTRNIQVPLAQISEELSLEDIFEGDTLTVRREISTQGKSKTFINGHLLPLSVAKRIGQCLVEFSGQHAHMVLREDSFALTVLDSSIPGMEKELQKFSALYAKERSLSSAIKKTQDELSYREVEIDRLKADIQAISNSDILNVDAEELFQRFSSLEQTKELSEALYTASDMLDGSDGRPSILSLMKTLKNHIERHQAADHAFQLLIQHVNVALAELSEASFSIKKRLSTCDLDERDLEKIEDQLSKIEKVEKRWGKDREEIRRILCQMKARVQELEDKDIELEELHKEYEKISSELDHSAGYIHDMRKKYAESLQKSIEDELKQLNMAACIFEIDVQREKRSETGDSAVNFYITPNTGEKRVLLSSGASGGEMARVFLAIQTVVSSMQKIPTIIFDEVDANIGGVTAIHVGKKLHTMGKSRQVIAITHFPQVAESADHHLSIQKIEEQARTYTTIRVLEEKRDQEREKSRMVGSCRL